jgi:segregation and condensation protein A
MDLRQVMIEIKTDHFEGPLGLLLQLIEKEEMDITQVSLAKIADQYIAHINSSTDINPDEMADFLVVAARLLLIKSKALLPFLHPEEEEEIEELERQLKMYKEFLEAMKVIEKKLRKKRFMFTRDPAKAGRKAILDYLKSAAGSEVNIFSPPKNLKANDLKNVFRDLLRYLKPPEKLEEEKLEYKVNIEDKIRAIKDILFNKIKVSFSKVLNNSKSKTEVIVCFLAVLELIKQRDIQVKQNGLFNEIEISKI